MTYCGQRLSRKAEAFAAAGRCGESTCAGVYYSQALNNDLVKSQNLENRTGVRTSMSGDFSPARRHERYSVVLSVVCRAGERTLADQVINLSCGGACVKTPTPLAPGSTHRFSFTVPDAKLRAIIVDVDATVTWASDRAMGLHFKNPCDGIDDYLKRLERAAHSR